jgi:hypothetical protein
MRAPARPEAKKPRHFERERAGALSFVKLIHSRTVPLASARRDRALRSPEDLPATGPARGPIGVKSSKPPSGTIAIA